MGPEWDVKTPDPGRDHSGPTGPWSPVTISSVDSDKWYGDRVSLSSPTLTRRVSYLSVSGPDKNPVVHMDEAQVSPQRVISGRR